METARIFLFQTRQIIITGDKYNYQSDDGRIFDDDGREDAVETWETESAWLTSEEAAAHGKAAADRFPLGWRVYPICAEGGLAKLLDSAPTSTP